MKQSNTVAKKGKPQFDINEQALFVQKSSDKVSLDDFDLRGILGQGSSGTVYKAYQKYLDETTGQKTLHRVVALKEVKIKQNITFRQYRELVNEVEIMKKIKHPNMIQLYDSFIDR